MKKLLVCVLALILIGCAALAEIDLSGLSYEELVELKDKINLAMWESEEWQEVTVPEGVWVVGEDIPAGHWTIRVAAERDYFYVSVFDEADDLGLNPTNHCTVYEDWDIASPGYSSYGDIIPEEVDIDMQEGWYFKAGGAVIFTPYTGKPDLGFK